MTANDIKLGGGSTDTAPRFFIIGTKYSRTYDRLPLMLEHGVVSTGFADEQSLEHLVGMQPNEVRTALDSLLPNEDGHALGTLSLFLSMRPGDIVALKSHSAPSGSQARLVIARYAVVGGRTRARYRLLEDLGHAISVDFFEPQEPLELPFGYGHTLHHVRESNRIANIFSPYHIHLDDPDFTEALLTDKSVHQSTVQQRGEYIMNRVHNELQNTLRRRLQEIHPDAMIKQEENYIDLSVTFPDRFILIEVKSSPSPTTCVRDAIGQMMLYAWKVRSSYDRIEYVVVGPNSATKIDICFLSHLCNTTGLKIRYCTPDEYQP